MERDILGLAGDSLFIEKIQRTFKAADADLLIQAHTFSQEKLCNGNSTGYRAANLLFDQEADATTIAGALLAPLLWQNLTDFEHVREHFGLDVATVLEDLQGSYSPQIDTRSVRGENAHALLASLGGIPRKATLYITFRLLALESAVGVMDNNLHA